MLSSTYHVIVQKKKKTSKVKCHKGPVSIKALPSCSQLITDSAMVAAPQQEMLRSREYTGRALFLCCHRGCAFLRTQCRQQCPGAQK